MRSEARVVITNPTGLHARPAVKLAQLAAGFDANVEIRAGDDGDWVRARSTARVMKLKVGAQSTIHFRAEGSQADDALSRSRRLRAPRLRRRPCRRSANAR